MLRITIRPRDALASLQALDERQLPFATANALNRTTEETQTRLQQAIHMRMAVRSAASAQFLERLVKVLRGDFATKAKLSTRISVTGPEGDEGRADVLTRHIEGGVHTVAGGPLSSFFIPADALRPTRMSIVERSMYPKNLRLMDRKDIVGTLHAKHHVTATGAVQIKGKQRTFVLLEKGTGRPLGVYQREGPHDIQILWFYTRRVVDPARWDFYGIAQRTFLERFPINMEGMYRAALATAR